MRDVTSCRKAEVATSVPGASPIEYLSCARDRVGLGPGVLRWWWWWW